MNKLSHNFHLQRTTADRYFMLQEVSRGISAKFLRRSDCPTTLQLPTGTALCHLDYSLFRFYQRSQKEFPSSIYSREKIRDSLERFLSTFHSLFHEYMQSEYANARPISDSFFAHSYKFQC